jgi:F-type H+-transporting ATPase subunit b
VAPAQDRPETSAEKKSGEAENEEEQGLEPWKWVNFAILVGALGWLIGKNAGPFFASRSQQIRKGIADAEQIRLEAEARVAAVDAQLANLATEIEQMRKAARDEQIAEGERIRQRTVAELAKAQERGEQEIAAAGKAARLELKRYAAQLALDLAAQKIQQRMNPESDDALVQDFVRELARPGAQAQSS